jgi:hypothetical protein
MIHTFSPRLGRCLAVVAALLAGALTPAVAQNAPSPSAAAVLAASLHAMGGEARLRSLTAIEYTALGERAMVEQSERPSGPYYADVQRIHMIRGKSASHGRRRLSAWSRRRSCARPQYLREAIGAINREHLTPKTIFGMHYDATPYQTLLNVDKKFAPPPTP